MAGGSLPRRLSHSSTATEWVDDAATDVCMNCHARFGVVQMRRKHHCRKCGKVICSACSRSREVVPEYHPVKPQRVCTSCIDSPTLPLAESPEEAAVAAMEAAKSGKRVKPLGASSLGSIPVPSGDDPQREFATLEVRVIEAKGLLAADFNLVTKKSSDPYCLLHVGHGVQVQTRTVSATLEPRWDTTIAFRISRADAILHLQVWDEDTATKDDAIGFVDLPLSRVPVSGEPLRGWVPLNLPEAQPLPGEYFTPTKGAGAVLLEVQLLDVQSRTHLYACVSPLPPVPLPPPHFDIDAVYGPAMHLVDLIWTRFVSPILFWLLDLIFWTSPKRSLIALFLWNFGARYFVQHYPAFLPLGLACFMLSFRAQKDESEVVSDATRRPTLLRKQTAPAILEDAPVESESAPALTRQDSHADYDEAQLGSAVQRLCFVLPSSVKELCRGFQPLLRTSADAAQMVHDIFVWDHDASPAVAAVLLLSSLVCEVLRFDILLMVIGSGALLACSPLPTALSGCISYVTLLRAKGQPQEWEMHPDYYEDWSSKDYRDVKGLASPSRSGMRLRHGKTMPALPKAPEASTV
eukprot:CAMPEP_0181454416 /NCGR_PEP_ID=MMETSP1110-20121109/30226_1 /TAXON_ID=174948 /ORGANISM="Symbiodinium sp., Strain CCMP421" /LENGTH=577 /DNA_ID=CAMNT_0023578759 /DNA_START=42 /DNA_END=1775 /DNA_ORIENTATION=+